MKAQFCIGTVTPFILPTETLTTVITFGSYFISNVALARLLTVDMLTKTWKSVLLFAVAGAVMDTIGVGIGVGAGVGVTIGVGVGVIGVGVDSGQRMTASITAMTGMIIAIR